ncbi:hypothetical protein [Parachlamydia sp. AcF125]|uniref:hypothetical protein n=1 Tax=Parachlamydia sp. AcF125 TaxID=2795736 RepID=UPI001BC9A399|nr:hypothetical protein [Parachlamydia sp. AcF125]MBS4168825.1 hypothetical protein [Parachlamydia sp. AcF125]
MCDTVIFTSHPFVYSCRENGEGRILTRELSTKAKVAILAITILSSPFVFFVGAIPIFFLLCAVCRARQPGFVRTPRVQPIQSRPVRTDESRSRFARNAAQLSGAVWRFGSVFVREIPRRSFGSGHGRSTRSENWGERGRPARGNFPSHVPVGERSTGVPFQGQTRERSLPARGNFPGHVPVGERSTGVPFQEETRERGLPARGNFPGHVPVGERSTGVPFQGETRGSGVPAPADNTQKKREKMRRMAQNVFQ